MSRDKIDFSSLDPARDEERWEATVQSVVSRALAARAQSDAEPPALPLTAPQLAAQWIRPALAIAAALALLVWLGALLARRPSPPQKQTSHDAAFVLSRWADSQERPSPSRIVHVLGARNGKK